MAVMPLTEPRHIEGPIPLGEPVQGTTRPPWRPSRRSLLVGAILVLVASLGLFGWRIMVRPVTVEVAGVSDNVPLQAFGLGAIGADVQSAVGFKVAGVLVKIAAGEGDHVKAGQILAQLDARDIAAQVAQASAGVLQAQAAIDKAQANVAAAQANLTNSKAMAARRSDLVKHGFASVEETQTNATAMQVANANLTVATTEVSSAQAGLATARAQQAFQEATLANDTLRAPYDAWVLARNLNLGAMPVPGQAVFTLVDPRTIWIVAYVDERLAGRLQVGQPAEIVLRSEPAKRFPGRVARIEIQSDAVNEERLVDVAFDRLPSTIHLAEQAEVYITTGTLGRTELVPHAAVKDLAGDRSTSEHGTVWTVEHGRLAQRPVTFGPELLDGRLPVVSGLPQDARIVVSPQTGLRAGRTATVATDAAR